MLTTDEIHEHAMLCGAECIGEHGPQQEDCRPVSYLFDAQAIDNFVCSIRAHCSIEINSHSVRNTDES